jgi:hypothetical protein
MKVWPKSNDGKWAAILTLLFVVLMTLKMTNAIRLPLPSPFIAVFGIVGLILGITAVFFHKERALLALLSIPVGLVIVFWIAAEFLFPH